MQFFPLFTWNLTWLFHKEQLQDDLEGLNQVTHTKQNGCWCQRHYWIINFTPPSLTFEGFKRIEKKREKTQKTANTGEEFSTLVLPDSLWCDSILHSTCKDISSPVEKILVLWCAVFPRHNFSAFLPSHFSLWYLNPSLKHCPVKPVLRDILRNSWWNDRLCWLCSAVPQLCSSQWKNHNYPSVCCSWATSFALINHHIPFPLQWGLKAFPLQWDSYDFNQSHHKEISREKILQLWLETLHKPLWWLIQHCQSCAASWCLFPFTSPCFKEMHLISLDILFLKKLLSTDHQKHLLQKSTQTVW